jgi:hypothetical protein
MPLLNETKFTHLKTDGVTKSITVPSTTAGSKLVVFVTGGAIATFRITNGSGTTFSRRNPYGGGSNDASWHDFSSIGGETIVHMTLNGAENVAGVIYEASELGAFVGASANGGGATVESSSDYQLRPTSSVTITQKSVLFGGFCMPETTPTNTTRRWRQFGPIGRLKTFDALQPGANSEFIWAAGMADVDETKSYPENLTTGQYRATSQFIASSGATSYAAQAAYVNNGSNINPSFSNVIERENSLPGSLRDNWFLGTAGTNSTIAGYTDKTSYFVGDTVNFKVDSTNNPFRVEVYRLGYYGAEQLGARNINGLGHITGTPAIQSAPSVDSTLGSTSCAWSTTASWTIPAGTTPGVYYVLLRRTDDTSKMASVHFVVKSNPADKTVVVVPDCTYQAYNIWGATTDNGDKSGTWTGKSLYQRGQDATVANFANRAYAVSFDRPYSSQSTQSNTYMFDSEFGMNMFMEAQGANLTYASDIDLEQNVNYLTTAKVVMPNGHTEYWSTNIWDAYKNARDAGVNIMFNASNIALWHTRFAVSDTNKRTMICYKDSGTVDISAGFTGTGRDPVSFTGTWRDTRTVTLNNTDRRPEDSLTGNMFKVNSPANESLDVPFAVKSYPIWRNASGIQALTTGQTYTTPVGVLGDEIDYVDPTSLTKPDNMVNLCPTVKSFSGKGSNANGTIYTGNTGNITLGFTLYRAESGALVFCTGSWRGWLTVSRWQKGNYQSGLTPDANWQNAMLAMMYDLGVELVAPKQMVPADSSLTDPSVGAPGPTREDIAIAYGLEVPVGSSGEGNFIGFFF